MSWPPTLHTVKIKSLYYKVSTTKPHVRSRDHFSKLQIIEDRGTIIKLLTLVLPVSSPAYPNKMTSSPSRPRQHRRQDHPCRRAHRLQCQGSACGWTPVYESDDGTGAQGCEQSSIKLVHLTVPVTLTNGHFGIFSNGLQTVFDWN